MNAALTPQHALHELLQSSILELLLRAAHRRSSCRRAFRYLSLHSHRRSTQDTVNLVHFVDNLLFEHGLEGFRIRSCDELDEVVSSDDGL